MIDVAIIGAGPAGASAAIALCDGGVASVTLIERGDGDNFRYGESANPGVRLLLDELRLSTQLDSLGHLTCRGSCSLWGGDELEYKDFHNLGHGYGWHLDRAAFDRWLCDEAQARGAKLLSGSKLLELSREQADDTPPYWQLRLDNGERLRANFVIDASGRSAFLATSLGFRVNKFDRLVAIALTLSGCDSELLANRSLVESAADGWWYATAIPGDRTVVMFMSDSDLVRDLDMRSREGFLRRLHDTRIVAKHMPVSVTADSQAMAPEIIGAVSQHTEQVVGPGWMAIGDAAIGLDPLTSSGISSALEDGMFAARAIIAQRMGDSTQMDAFAMRIDKAWDLYLQQRNENYSQETRWRTNTFWQRRHKASSGSGG